MHTLLTVTDLLTLLTVTDWLDDLPRSQDRGDLCSLPESREVSIVAQLFGHHTMDGLPWKLLETHSPVKIDFTW